MRRTPATSSTRTATSLGVVSLAALSVAALLSVGTANADRSDGGQSNGGSASVGSTPSERRELQLVATTLALHTNSAGRDGPADVYGYKTRLTRDGRSFGREHCSCTAVDKDNLVCTGLLRLPGGTLTYTVPFRNSTLRGTGAITGGTGDYVGKTGTFSAVGRKGTDPQVYDYTLRIRQLDR